MNDPLYFFRLGRWEEIILLFFLFILGMGTFLPFFLLFWLGVADIENKLPSDFEEQKNKEELYIAPPSSPFAEAVYHLSENSDKKN